MTKKLMMGNEAMAHAALMAGVSVVAGYPGTPSSEVIETIAKCVADGSAESVHVEWSTNEKAALEVLAGASYAGARTLFTCKQVGLNVASDPLMSLNYVGVEGGCVLYVADDPGPISSQTEQDTRRFAAFAKLPVFDPENIEQGMAMMPTAFRVSEEFHTPVIMRPTTRVCHSSTYVDVWDHTIGFGANGFKKDDSRFVIFPARAYRGHLEVNERLAVIADEFSTPLFEEFNPIEEHGESPTLGIVCGGVSTAYAREALALLDQAVQAGELPAYRFMQVGTPYPFPEARANEFVEGLERIIVFEELDYVLEDAFSNLMGKRAIAGKSVAQVLGKLTGTTITAGENSTDIIKDELAAFFGVQLPTPAQATADIEVELPIRPPVLCPGCPHRGAFFAAKQAARGTKTVFSGDIGCYTLGNAKPLNAVDTCLCMGAGITMAQGLKIVEPDVKQIAFVGDSTFFASGMTGVANAVYNQHDIVVCVLDNSITAMTGGQPHPGTGQTLMGPQTPPLNVHAVLEALGVQHIEHANPHHLQESVDVMKRALDFEGPSAVIFEAPCVNLIRKGAPVEVDEDACRKCMACIKRIGCPAIGFDGYDIVIDETLCNGCVLCTQVCPFEALVLPETAGQEGGAR